MHRLVALFCVLIASCFSSIAIAQPTLSTPVDLSTLGTPSTGLSIAVSSDGTRATALWLETSTNNLLISSSTWYAPGHRSQEKAIGRFTYLNLSIDCGSKPRSFHARSLRGSRQPPNYFSLFRSHFLDGALIDIQEEPALIPQTRRRERIGALWNSAVSESVVVNESGCRVS